MIPNFRVKQFIPQRTGSFKEDVMFRDLFTRTSEQLRTTQDTAAWQVDYTMSAYAVWKDKLRPRAQFVATSNWWYKFAFVQMIMAAIHDLLDKVHDEHSFKHNQYWHIRPSHAGDYMEHLMFRALETRRFAFFEGMTHLYTAWQYGEVLQELSFMEDWTQLILIPK